MPMMASPSVPNEPSTTHGVPTTHSTANMMPIMTMPVPRSRCKSTKPHTSNAPGTSGKSKWRGWSSTRSFIESTVLIHKIRATLANSEGCRPIGPMLSQARFPLTSCPSGVATTSINITSATIKATQPATLSNPGPIRDNTNATGTLSTRKMTCRTA